MLKFNKKPKLNDVSNDEYNLARVASLKLTPAQFYALIKVISSDAHRSGLMAFYKVQARIED